MNEKGDGAENASDSVVAVVVVTYMKLGVPFVCLQKQMKRKLKQRTFRSFKNDDDDDDVIKINV